MHKTGAAVPEGQEFTIAGLTPSRAQKRLALGVFIVLLTGLALPMGQFGSVPLARLHAFVPVYATAMAVTDLLTAVLLFAQFSILRTKALLVISSGYLFTGLMAVPWMLTFPGAFTPEGLLGAGLHTTSWIYILWHGGFPLFVLGYALLKDQDEPVKQVWPGSSAVAILASVVMVVVIVAGADPFGHRRARPGAASQCYPGQRKPYPGNHSWHRHAARGPRASRARLRRRSVLDLWLMIVMCAFIIEIVVITYPHSPPRFSVGWYSGRFYGFVSASIVLFVLLYETTALYALLFRALVAERRERNARLMTWDTVSASIAHEIRQPLAAVIMNAQAGLRWLRRPQPDIGEAEEAFDSIARDGRRAEDIIGRTRAIYRKDAGERIALDINELVKASLALMRAELEMHRVSVHMDLSEGLPRVKGDKVQLQQVLVNLTTNAIDSIAATEGGERVLRVRSGNGTANNVTILVEDSGRGVEATDMDEIFNPLFTTKSQGMGMGLTICRSIVEAHDGRLWAAPNRPRGAVFQFSLPAMTQ